MIVMVLLYTVTDNQLSSHGNYMSYRVVTAGNHLIVAVIREIPYGVVMEHRNFIYAVKNHWNIR